MITEPTILDSMSTEPSIATTGSIKPSDNPLLTIFDGKTIRTWYIEDKSLPVSSYLDQQPIYQIDLGLKLTES